ncbi:MAG: hypothetical protein E4H00_08485 [Myxococcales bacterium]|nr:MAG: hypothetical protein E4H00_08485 [Myxococcales bacterium]
MILINVIGGVAVLGSYAYGLLTYPNAGTVLLGGVPEALRPLYTASMLSATVGYFAFTGFLLFAVDPDRVRLATTRHHPPSARTAHHPASVGRIFAQRGTPEHRSTRAGLSDKCAHDTRRATRTGAGRK